MACGCSPCGPHWYDRDGGAGAVHGGRAGILHCRRAGVWPDVGFGCARGEEGQAQVLVHPEHRGHHPEARMSVGCHHARAHPAVRHVQPQRRTQSPTRIGDEEHVVGEVAQLSPHSHRLPHPEPAQRCAAPRFRCLRLEEAGGGAAWCAVCCAAYGSILCAMLCAMLCAVCCVAYCGMLCCMCAAFPVLCCAGHGVCFALHLACCAVCCMSCATCCVWPRGQSKWHLGLPPAAAALSHTGPGELSLHLHLPGGQRNIVMPDEQGLHYLGLCWQPVPVLQGELIGQGCQNCLLLV